MDQAMDEKAFAEQAFAEQEWVARYLNGRLSDTEAELFEQHWARNPALIREIELQARIKDGLHTLQARGELERLVQRPWWGGSLRLMALAASLAVIAVSSWLWLAASHSASQLRAATQLDGLPGMLGRSVALTNTYHLMRLRGAAAGPTLRLPTEASPLLLRVLPEAVNETGRYRISIMQLAEGNRLEQSIDLPAAASGADGFVDIYLDSHTLQPARYRLSIAAAGDTAAVADTFEFQVVAADTTL